MSQTEIASFYPKSRSEWRKWLEEHHNSQESVWLICYKKGSGKPIIRWSDLVEEALCFGWIDSKRQPIDEDKFRQFYCKRKPSGTWSRVNKEKVEQLIKKGLMSKAGLESIEIAKQNGSWTILDEVENLIVPEDLGLAFTNHPGSKDYFLGLSKSAKKILLSWIVLAKRAETRQKRIDEIAENAKSSQLPVPFR
ncbi:MAG: YdeI/OmpD-associated family protein [Marinoscillum sp.]